MDQRDRNRTQPFLYWHNALYRHTALLLTLFAGIVLFSACVQQQDSAPQTDTGRFNIELLPPEPDTGSLIIRLTDSDGQPITDAQVSLEGNMNHAGMAPVLSESVSDGDDGSTDGLYQIPFEFTMFGDWIITVSADINGDMVAQDFNVSVDAEGAKLSGP